MLDPSEVIDHANKSTLADIAFVLVQGTFDLERHIAKTVMPDKGAGSKYKFITSHSFINLVTTRARRSKKASLKALDILAIVSAYLSSEGKLDGEGQLTNGAFHSQGVQPRITVDLENKLYAVVHDLRESEKWFVFWVVAAEFFSEFPLPRPSGALARLQYQRKKVISDTPSDSEYVQTGNEDTRQETLNAQQDVITLFLDLTGDMEQASGEVQQVRKVIELYARKLHEGNFLSADSIFRSISNDVIDRQLFETETGLFRSITNNHLALQSLSPMYAEYATARAAGVELEKTRKGRAPFSEGVVETPIGQELLDETVKDLVKELEEQRDAGKSAVDTKNLADHMRDVLRRVPEIEKAGTSIDKMIDLLNRWSSGL